MSSKKPPNTIVEDYIRERNKVLIEMFPYLKTIIESQKK